MLQGSLDNFGLDEVLDLLATTAKTGRMRITGDRGSGSLWLTSGKLVGSEASQIDASCPPDETMFELLRFTTGNFSFNMDEAPTEPADAQAVSSVLEAAFERLSQWREIEAVVPSLAHVIAPVATLPTPEVTISTEEWDLLMAIGAGAEVGGICDHFGLGEVEGSRRVKLLVERSLITIEAPAPVATPLTTADSDDFGLAPAGLTTDEPVGVSSAVGAFDAAPAPMHDYLPTADATPAPAPAAAPAPVAVPAPVAAEEPAARPAPTFAAPEAPEPAASHESAFDADAFSDLAEFSAPEAAPAVTTDFDHRAAPLPERRVETEAERFGVEMLGEAAPPAPADTSFLDPSGRDPERAWNPLPDLSPDELINRAMEEEAAGSASAFEPPAFEAAFDADDFAFPQDEPAAAPAPAPAPPAPQRGLLRRVSDIAPPPPPAPPAAFDHFDAPTPPPPAPPSPADLVGSERVDGAEARRLLAGRAAERPDVDELEEDDGSLLMQYLRDES